MQKNLDESIQELIVANNKSKNKIFDFVKENARTGHLSPKTLGMLFEMIADIHYDPDNPYSCFSREVTIKELTEIHPDFETNNGCQWARTDGSYLGKRYHIVRELKNGKVYSVRLDGPNDKKKSHYIRPDIRKEINKKRCAVLDTSVNLEVDHKNGRYDDSRIIPTEKQSVDMFQPLSKPVNDCKRQHCKRCQQTKKRYDARNLGFSVGWICGDENTSVCAGCYWYDVAAFHKEISKNYTK